MKKEKREKKPPYRPDDGHTVYDMSGLRTPLGDAEKEKNVGLSKKEQSALIRAALEYALPRLFAVILCFALTMLLVKLWLGV